MWPPVAGRAAVSSVASSPRCVHSTVHSSSPRSLMDQVFEEGDIVEVESTERGFEGSRAKATLLAALPGGHWRVRYVHFVDAVGRRPLLGEVHEKYLRPPPPKPPPGAAEWVPGVGAPPRHPQPTRTNLLARRLMKRAKACIWAIASGGGASAL